MLAFKTVIYEKQTPVFQSAHALHLSLSYQANAKIMSFLAETKLVQNNNLLHPADS